MLLSRLLARLPDAKWRGADVEITSIAYDSRRVKAGSLFVAMKGDQSDGQQYINQAVERGAVAVLSEQAEAHPRAATVHVASARAALAEVAVAFYENPSRHLKVAGVTGTNGKTTFTFLFKHICEQAQMPCGLIGTVRYEIGHRVLPATRTTPESLDLQEMLAQIRNAGCKAAVLEASSHAMVQERVRGIEFDAAVFTNLTQDHLDYHGSMENYFEAKARLFEHVLAQTKKKGAAVVNLDDRHGAKLHHLFAKEMPLLTYGMNARADFRGSNLRIDFTGTSFQLDAQEKSYLVRLPHIGRFNVFNALAAIAAATTFGISVRNAVLALAGAPAVPGRLEAVPAKRQFRVFVDYAHTPDALENVLTTLRELRPRRLITVFGCGGNRDRAKRPLMAAAVEAHSDYAIVTSDNPRKEDPGTILADTVKGFRGSAFEIIAERDAAIHAAVAMAEPRDIVLLAGKGHETYQEFADHTVPFDDVQVAQRAIEANPVKMV